MNNKDELLKKVDTYISLYRTIEKKLEKRLGKYSLPDFGLWKEIVQEFIEYKKIDLEIKAIDEKSVEDNFYYISNWASDTFEMANMHFTTTFQNNEIKMYIILANKLSEHELKLTKNSTNEENYYFTTKIWERKRIIGFCFQTIQYIRKDLLKSEIEFDNFVLEIDFDDSEKVDMFIKDIYSVRKKLKSQLSELHKKQEQNTKKYKELYSAITE